jgi:diguanylate cyclase (GGDEF)-like protein
VPFLFGVLRLSIAKMLGVAVLFIAGYALVLFRDITLVRAANETYLLGLQLWITAAAFFWFALFAGYVGRLRKKTADANTKLEAALQQVQKLVSYDELTGLHTRRHILDILTREKGRSDRSGRGFCLFMIDLDHFKSINDNFGHAVGDSTLRHFAECIAPMLRPSDVMARFGGEEFLLLGMDTDLQGAVTVAERIRSATESMQVPGLPAQQRVTASIGVAEFRPAESINQALQRADMALYAAKLGGRNRVEFAATANATQAEANFSPEVAPRP